nr:immunoglobulin heavy chain junction region [Macaca mulatta]MOY29969.1 immunoglobulin heavy chain junction region [Macaca mulatta]
CATSIATGYFDLW